MTLQHSHDIEREIASIRPAVASAAGESFWRKEQPVLDTDNGVVLTGGMFKHQRRWWELPNFIKVLIAGYGGGKTFVGAKRIISLALTNAPVPVCMVSPSYSVARNTTISTVSELLDARKRMVPPGALRWKYHATHHEFQINYRGVEAKIIVYSGDNPDSMRGPNLAGGWIDEPFLQPQEVFDQLVARTRHPRGKHLEITLTGTPEELNWGYDLCEGELRERHDVGVVRASTLDNEALPSAYIERLQAAFRGAHADAYIDGGFVNLATGLVFHAFDRKKHVIELEQPDDAELGLGLDFNVNPMSAVVFWHRAGRLHVVREIMLQDSDTEKLVSFVRSNYPNLLNVYPDATGARRQTSAPGGKTDFWYIRRSGLFIHAPSKAMKRRDGYNAVNALFAQDNCTIDPSCHNLIKYLTQYSYERMSRQEELGHLLDAFRYPIQWLYPVSSDAFRLIRVKGY